MVPPSTNHGPPPADHAGPTRLIPPKPQVVHRYPPTRDSPHCSTHLAETTRFPWGFELYSSPISSTNDSPSESLIKRGVDLKLGRETLSLAFPSSGMRQAFRWRPDHESFDSFRYDLNRPALRSTPTFEWPLLDPDEKAFLVSCRALRV